MDLASGIVDPWLNITAGDTGSLAIDQKEKQAVEYGHRKTTLSDPFLSGVSEEAVGIPEPISLVSRRTITHSEGNLTTLVGETGSQEGDPGMCMEATGRSAECSGMLSGLEGRDWSKLMGELKALERRYSIESGSKPGKTVMALSLLSGVWGTFNLFGLAGTSPTVAEKVLLSGAIAGITVLHSGSAFETIKSFLSGFPDFKSKPDYHLT